MLNRLNRLLNWSMSVVGMLIHWRVSVLNWSILDWLDWGILDWLDWSILNRLNRGILNGLDI